MSQKLIKRVDLNDETFVTAMKLFEVPPQFYEQARLMLTNEEIVLIANMGLKTWSVQGLFGIIAESDLAEEKDAIDFIDSSWRRSVIDKVEDDETREIKYKIADFYCRHPIFAQYEPEKYATIPKPIIDALSDWNFGVYLSAYRKVILNKLKGTGSEEKMHQSDFLTLEETLRAIDETPNDISVVPCNCRAIVRYHNKNVDNCITIGPRQYDINSQQNRGYGRKLSKEEAKELVKNCNKEGLMHSGEDGGFCHCDAVACFPMRMSKELGARLVYPRAHYSIDWRENECINCGKCTKICNFGAFAYDAYSNVAFNPERCYGCTICSNNCPKKAIRLIKLPE